MHASRTVESQFQAPRLRGRMFAIFDSRDDCELGLDVLFEQGFDDCIVLEGEAGVRELERIMEGKQWGESAENVYQDGIAALHDGRSLLFVEVKALDDAARMAELIKPFGAHDVYHFGDLVDTRLTP